MADLAGNVRDVDRERLHALVAHILGRAGDADRANDTPAPRRATVINVFRDGVMSNSDEPLLAGIPVIPRGQKMGGQFFPLLFEPA